MLSQKPTFHPSNWLKPRLSLMPRRLSVAVTASKEVWVCTKSKEVLTTILESGLDASILVDEDSAVTILPLCSRLGIFKSFIIMNRNGALTDHQTSHTIGTWSLVASAEDLHAAEQLYKEDTNALFLAVFNNSADTRSSSAAVNNWSIIPIENLIAAKQKSPGSKLIATAPDADTAKIFLEALERGTDGVALTTEDPHQVRALAAYQLESQQREVSNGAALAFDVAEITGVTPVGSGDRACVDLACAMVPGEGALVGSFARTLFLVDSESEESEYISSRPFRINAGAIHSYCLVPGGKTKYLSELKSGSEIMVVNAEGRMRTGLVGRVKIESRPLLLIEARVQASGDTVSTLLQNAETVKLIESDGGTPMSVCQLKRGDCVLVKQQHAARHTGIQIDEAITER